MLFTNTIFREVMSSEPLISCLLLPSMLTTGEQIYCLTYSECYCQPTGPSWILKTCQENTTNKNSEKSCVLLIANIAILPINKDASHRHYTISDDNEKD